MLECALIFLGIKKDTRGREKRSRWGVGIKKDTYLCENRLSYGDARN